MLRYKEAKRCVMSGWVTCYYYFVIISPYNELASKMLPKLFRLKQMKPYIYIYTSCLYREFSIQILRAPRHSFMLENVHVAILVTAEEMLRNK